MVETPVPRRPRGLVPAFTRERRGPATRSSVSCVQQAAVGIVITDRRLALSAQREPRESRAEAGRNGGRAHDGRTDR